MAIEDTPEFQARLAAAINKGPAAMLVEEARLRREFPGQSDAWYAVGASLNVQRANQKPWYLRIFGG